jgi:hypothetical protein
MGVQQKTKASLAATWYFEKLEQRGWGWFGVRSGVGSEKVQNMGTLSSIVIFTEIGVSEARVSGTMNVHF